VRRRKLKDRYRRLSYLSDLGGMMSALGELRGLGYPPQPRLNRAPPGADGGPALDEAWFQETIREKIVRHPENSMEYPFFGERIFDEPLVGFVRGDDPLFGEFKKIIGPHHFTPEEIMGWQAIRNRVPPPPASELSVVSFVMPITRATREENASRTDWPSERWAQTRLHGEMFSQRFVREIVSELMDHGVLAVAPDVTPLFNKKRYPGVGWASPWSHRHVAYAAGLGTFGMHDFFITEKGCVHRVGSFVVHRRLEPNRARPADIHAWCLHHQGRACLKCAERCPAGAITERDAHDKERCYQRVARSTAHCNRHYHIFIYGCGLCSVGVPCSTGIPAPLRPKGASEKPGSPPSRKKRAWKTARKAPPPREA